MNELLTRIGEELNAFFDTIYFGSLNQLILCFAIGAVVASIAAVYQRKLLGEIVRYLLEEHAESPASGKTLADAGMKKNFLVRHALRNGSTLRRVVSITIPEQEAPLSDTASDIAKSARGNASNPVHKGTKHHEKPDWSTAKLYIAPGQPSYRATHLYTEQGNGIGAVLLTIVIATVLAILCFLYLPDVIQFVINAKGLLF